MGRKWKGVLAIEGVQTGDGRVIAEGALEWPDPPLPLGWLKASMHGGLEGGVDAGTILTIERVGNEIMATGVIDDGHEDGQEIIRRLSEGTAPLGSRWGLSIDPDDWVVEIVDTDPSDDEEDGGILLLASGRGPKALAAAMSGFSSAAGEPDPEGGDVIYTEDVGKIISRFTHLRIRGVTLVQIPAIVDSYLELDGEAEETIEPAEEQLAASARPHPPRDYFETAEPEEGDPRLLLDRKTGGYYVPLTITDPDEHGWRHVFGHLAHWGQCHVGYPDSCRTVPPSPSNYAEYRLHTVTTDQGDVITGPLLMSCDHVSTDYRTRVSLEAARDQYANTGLAWADVTIEDGQWGPWISGVVREDVDEKTLRTIKASGWSGDWRPKDGKLDLCAIQSVPTPGFPQLRLVAGGRLEEVEPWTSQIAYDEDGEIVALIVASAAPHSDCGCGGTAAAITRADLVNHPLLASALRAIQGDLAVLERRTRHLVKAEAAALAASLD